MKLTNQQKAYLAGFLDGDGSIYIKLTKNSTYRYHFQIAPYVVFYQSIKEKTYMENLQKMIGKGYIRIRKDKMVEYIIGDFSSIEELLYNLLPFLQLKKKQAKLMLRILDEKQRVENAGDFLKICKKVDVFEKLNYSKKRKQNSDEVRKILIDKDLLTP